MKRCPCCGYLTIDDSDEIITDICEVCFWQYDEAAQDAPDRSVGPNRVSLNMAKKNFKLFGAVEERFLDMVRPPYENERKSAEQEWQWCLVGNIVEENEYGENHELRHGNKQFRPHAKVFINFVYGGMGHESILVIGLPRHSCKYIEIVIARKYVENFRLQKVFKPAVLKRMNQSEWNWWGNTDSARDTLIKFLEWLNPEEAEKAKCKFIDSDWREC